MGPLIFAAGWLFGSALAWRALRETCWLLILTIGPLLGSATLLGMANARVAPGWGALGLLLASFVLLALPGTRAKDESVSEGGADAPDDPTAAQANTPVRPRPVWVAMGRSGKVGLGILSAIVVVYTHFHGVHVVDPARCLHDAQIVALGRGVFPPVDPIISHQAAVGDYGRDLFMAALNTGNGDPVGTVWWISPILQLAAFLTLYASTRSLTGSSCRGFLVAGMIFFGMDCGHRVGMLDSFDGVDGLAFPQLVLLTHVIFRVFLGSGWPVWLVCGLVLGTYQLVSMTFFALFLMAGLGLFLLKARTREAWTGLAVVAVLSAGLVLFDGGAIGGGFVTQSALFQVRLSTNPEHRTSVAYNASLFRSLDRPARVEGDVSLFSPELLRLHWLPLYLAPLTLWMVRRWVLGLFYWIFGAVAFLLPGLLAVGPPPLFEAELFRLEMAAAYGFAGALALALAEVLESRPISFSRQPVPALSFAPGSGRYLLALAVLVASLAAGEKAVNDAIIDSGEKGFRWFPTVRQWRLEQPVFGMTADAMDACAWLRKRTRPGQRVLTNLLDGRPTGLWPDTAVATLAGVFSAGHARLSDADGSTRDHLAFGESSLSKAFWASADLSLLEGTGIRWLLADTARLRPEVVKKLEEMPHQTFGAWLAVGVPERAGVEAGEWSLTGPVSVPPGPDLRPGERFDLRVPFRSDKESRAVLKVQDSTVDPLRFTIPAGQGVATLSLVTPFVEGVYHAALCDPAGKEMATFDLVVDFLKRLEGLSANLSIPPLKVGRMYTLPAEWKGTTVVHSKGELDLYYRFRRPDGDYAWEVDSIPQPVELNLPEAPAFTLQIMTPAESGTYRLELWFFDRDSGRRVRTGAAFNVTVQS